MTLSAFTRSGELSAAAHSAGALSCHLELERAASLIILLLSASPNNLSTDHKRQRVPGLQRSALRASTSPRALTHTSDKAFSHQLTPIDFNHALHASVLTSASTA